LRQIGRLEISKGAQLASYEDYLPGTGQPWKRKILGQKEKKMTTTYEALDKALDKAFASLDKAEALRSDPRTPPDTAFKAEREAFFFITEAMKQYLALVEAIQKG